MSDLFLISYKFLRIPLLSLPFPLPSGSRSENRLNLPDEPPPLPSLPGSEVPTSPPTSIKGIQPRTTITWTTKGFDQTTEHIDWSSLATWPTPGPFNSLSGAVADAAGLSPLRITKKGNVEQCEEALCFTNLAPGFPPARPYWRERFCSNSNESDLLNPVCGY